MVTRGEYRDENGTYGVIMDYTKAGTELVLVVAGEVVSAFKSNKEGQFSYKSIKGKDLFDLVSTGIKGCTAKNGNPIPFKLGTSIMHQFTKTKIEYSIENYNNELCGAEIISDKKYVYLEHADKSDIPKNIPYTKLTLSRKQSNDIQFSDGEDGDNIVTRTVQEIALYKEDVTWLNGKKYYIVNDDAQAEKIFEFLDNYSGPIAYDTETTGLKINCFSKINSKYKHDLEKWNYENPDDAMRADKLVGIIFCVEKDVSYYFPCANRKFKNLYEEDTETRRQTLDKIKASYTIGELRDKQGEMAEFIRNTPVEDWTPDIILMERVRKILETKHIVAHNGAFEWKCGWIYEIDTNITDDTMILHQIMYKFRTTTSNRGEPSNLKYLAKTELGIEQWELGDFFPDFKEDKKGTVRGKGSKSVIDFSYMDYAGTKIYAPTDGDVTFQLFMKYKTDMITNHKEQEYLYSVEILVACAIGYMEFYGVHIDEDKIKNVKEQTETEVGLIESQIRQLVNYSSPSELDLYNEVSELLKQNKQEHSVERHELMVNKVKQLTAEFTANENSVLNLGSPAQVAELFYDKLEIPFTGDKKSVAKNALKPLLKQKNEEGEPKYPVVNLYSEYKNKLTLLQKFFDNLPNFMYPGGFIFASFGQISTATGRMSCSRPNVQQFPKSVTSIVTPRHGFGMADADFSQIEYRVLVALSGEKFLAELFEDPDNDYHTLMASLMYDVPYASVTPEMRSDSKSYNFGIPYGMGIGSLAILLRGANTPSTREEAAEKYELYFKNQPNTRKFFDQVKEMAQVNKYTKTFWNRYRYYSFTDKDGKENSGKKAAALRQAGNAVIQGSAADVFKISVARNWMYIRQNGLIGKMLIINMVHDEQLFEIDVQQLNMQRVLSDIGRNMQFKVDGFPPLFIGAGVGNSWTQSKGKMAEIHPHLLDQFTKESMDIPIYKTPEEASVWTEPSDVVDYFGQRIHQFRVDTVMNYILNTENHGEDIHPAVGNLLNLQFTFGKKHNKDEMSDTDYTLQCLQEFINHYNLEGVSSDMFKMQQQLADIEEDAEYDDEDEENDDLDIGDGLNTNFALIDESDVIFGTDVHQIIATFGSVVAPHLNLCGVDTRSLSYKEKDALTDFFMEHLCEPDDAGAMQIVFLNEANVLHNTGIWINGVSGSDLERRIKLPA